MNSILLPLTQAAAAPTSRTWFDNPAIQNKLGYALVETLAMTFVSGAITVILGLLLGLALVSTGKRGQFRNPTLYWVLSQIVNIGRSMPFIILMVALIPLTRLLVGTSLGWQAACVPLTIGAIPFYARLVETAINDVDRGKVEAALMMGASGRQITWGVLVREALPILIQSATVTIITLLGYSAMAGAVGIDTERVDRLTFGLGCGIAGIAGSAFTMIGSTGPTSGQLYIVDTFLIVVFGGAASLLGTIASAFSISQTQSTLEFFLSGSMASVITLLLIVGILLLRPQGLFVLKVRR